MRLHFLLLFALLANGAQARARAQAQGSESASSAQVTGPAASDTTLERLTREVAAELRCPVCQGLSLQDSPSELSQEMKDVVRAQLAEGKSPEEVKAYFVSKYGEWILMEPKAEGFNLAVYVLPVVMLLAGGGFVFVTARRWVRAGDGADATSDLP